MMNSLVQNVHQQPPKRPPQILPNMIVDRLHRHIHDQQPEHASKITGMLLEMDFTDLLSILKSPDALRKKIVEVLVQHQASVVLNVVHRQPPRPQPLTAQMLAAASEEQRTNMIGERYTPLYMLNNLNMLLILLVCY